nr:DUF551 domain-containing protein [Enterobacter kobei]
MSTITRERIEQLANGNNICKVTREERIELARIALASLEAEPIYFVEIEDGQDINAGRIEGKNRPDLSLLPDGINHLYAAPPAPVVPAELHHDTRKLVTDFCTALAEKLYKAQLKYGYDADWKQDGWPTQCQAHFHQHIAKGDPRDVAAYCAFMWYHGWKTEPAPVSVPDEDLLHMAASAIDDLLSNKDRSGAVVWAYVPAKLRRAAMLQGADGNSQVMNDYPETLPCPVSLEPGLKFRKGVATKILLEALQRRANYSAEIEIIKEICGDIKDGDFLAAAKINGSSELVNTAYKLPANTPCKDAPEHIWLQTAGVWPENGEFSELTWCSDNQHPDDTLYVRADVVTGNSPVVPNGWVACSERMPEVGVKVLCFPVNDEPIHATYNGQVWLQDISWSTSDEPIDNVISCNVFHWMPLPAAPQQGVK